MICAREDCRSWPSHFLTVTRSLVQSSLSSIGAHHFSTDSKKPGEHVLKLLRLSPGTMFTFYRLEIGTSRKDVSATATLAKNHVWSINLEGRGFNVEPVPFWVREQGDFGDVVNSHVTTLRFGVPSDRDRLVNLPRANEWGHTVGANRLRSLLMYLRHNFPCGT